MSSCNSLVRTLGRVIWMLLLSSDLLCLLLLVDYCLDSLLVEFLTCDQKVASLNPGRSSGRNFVSRVNFLCWLLFVVGSTPVLPQLHVKDPGHSSNSADGRLHLNTHTPLTKQSWVGWLCRCAGVVWEPVRKQVHMQLVREHSATVISVHWATVDWSWPKEWN